jgi:hypothetical protein
MLFNVPLCIAAYCFGVKSLEMHVTVQGTNDKSHASLCCEFHCMHASRISLELRTGPIKVIVTTNQIYYILCASICLICVKVFFTRYSEYASIYRWSIGYVCAPESKR